MIDPTHTPRGYDLPMELACCVPPSRSASLADLADDFGLKGPAVAHGLIQKLKVRGFGLDVHNSANGRTVSWLTAQLALDGMKKCIIYWDAVYPRREVRT